MRYREVVPSPFWMNALLFAAAALTLGGCLGFWGPVAELSPELGLAWPLLWVIPVAVVVLIPLLFGRLEIAVEAEELVVRFGHWPLIQRRYRLADIRSARATDYRPILTFGGWGIRRGRLDGEQTLAYTLQGTSAVVIELSSPVRDIFLSTRFVLIGSLDPHALVSSLGMTGSSPSIGSS